MTGDDEVIIRKPKLRAKATIIQHWPPCNYPGLKGTVIMAYFSNEHGEWWLTPIGRREEYCYVPSE
jgi:hypothetical protein